MKKNYWSCLLIIPLFLSAQTDIDGIMMDKHNLCIGVVYQSSSWKSYWEGTFKRENLNLGTVSTKGVSIMGNYGITDKLNFIFSVPYLKTNATAGTMIGQKGIQDLSLTLKYMPIEKTYGKNTVAFYVIGSFSTPLTDYVADYLPLSIGLQSKTASLRLMGDYQIGHLFATLSTAYTKRFTINIDRNSYYTTKMHYTNVVDMPDAFNANARMGYRSNRLIAEAIFDTFVTTGETFDITTNNMPFPSNTMNMTKIALNAKYTFKFIPSLAVVGGFNHVTSGRNVGQSDSFYGGIFYTINFKKNK